MYGYGDIVKREAVYYIGNDLFIRGKLDSAKTFFEECEKISKTIDVEEESGFLINASIFLGKIYDVLGWRDKAVAKYKAVLTYREYGQSHQAANDYIKYPYKRN